METVLTEFEAKKVLRKYGIKTTKDILAHSKKEALQAAKKIGYPVVLKVESSDIIHKTEADAVAVGIESDKELGEVYDKLLRNVKKHKKDARIDGVSIQETLSGRELIVGSSYDPQFGPTIAFGLGGILVEVLKDVSFRIIPITKADALEMVEEIKGYAVLKGVRGRKPANINAIVDVLLKVSQLITENPDIRELDINPLFVDNKKAVAADARILKK